MTFGLRNGMDAGVFREQEVTPLAHLLIGAMTEGALMVLRPGRGAPRGRAGAARAARGLRSD